MAWTASDDLHVFAVGDADDLRDAVDVVHRTVAPELRVVVIGGRSNSLAELEKLQESLRTQYDALVATTGRISGFGVDVVRNRVRIELFDPTEQAITFLEREFGADRVDVARGAGWQPV